MDSTRRRVIACSALSSVLLGTSGCLSNDPISSLNSSARDPRVNFAGNVSTGKPLLRDADLSTEAAYPHHYSGVVGSKDGGVRWEYVRREVPQFVDDLDETDFDAEFLLFFGMVLSPTKQLQSGSSTYEDGTLYSTYRIAEASSASSKLSINTHVTRVEGETIPDDVEFGVRF